jgi:hypothetical protein
MTDYIYFPASNISSSAINLKLWKVPVDQKKRFKIITSIGAFAPFIIMLPLYWLMQAYEGVFFITILSGMAIGGISYYLATKIGEVIIIKASEGIKAEGFSAPRSMMFFPIISVVWILLIYITPYFSMLLAHQNVFC